MAHSIRVEHVFPVSPERLYKAWLDAAEHSAFTGSSATIEPVVGAKHTAWDGYIQGTILELVPGVRIVKAWRSSDFDGDAPDSRVEVILEAVDGGTRLVLLHSEIPEGQPDYESGWAENYFAPMSAYFVDAEIVPEASKPTTKKPAAKKPAAAKKPIKKAAAKKPAKKVAAKKPAEKVAAKKPVKKVVAKKPAKKAAKKTAKPTKKAAKPAKKPAKKAAAKKASKPVKKPAKKTTAKKAAKKPLKKAPAKKAAGKSAPKKSAAKKAAKKSPKRK